METNAQYFNFLCRTCMNKVNASSHDGTTKPQQQWLSIFDLIEECGALRIAELLSDAVPQIVVQQRDELPKKICTECLQRLLSVYRFQQMCVQSDKQMQELLSKNQTVLKTPMLDEAIKGETETNDAVSQPLNDLPCSNTLQNLQQPSIQEPFEEVLVQTIEPEAAQSSADDNSQDNNKLLEHDSNDSQGEFGAFIKNEPIEDGATSSEYSDGDTMHSTISVTKDELIEFEEQQENVISSRYNCHLCNKSYKKRKYLRTHLSNHKEKANNSKEYCYACHLCSESYNEQRYLSLHLNLAHSIEPQVTCDICNKSFGSSAGLRQHMRTHTGERPYECPECGKSFIQKSGLTVHRKTHSKDKPYECPYCPKTFVSKSQMAHHKISHEEVAKRFECDICGKKFRWKSMLLTHKLIHSGEKHHKCDFCERGFTNHTQLLIHNRQHTGEKRYKCKYCERAYIVSSSLNTHLRRHLGANIYRCKLCPLAFPLDSEMRLHFITHKNEDPETRERNFKALQEEEAKLKLKFSKEEPSTETKRHKCSICEKKFKIRSDLKKHQLIHSEEKPHKCDLCEKQFAQMGQLKVHTRIHTGEKPHKCKYCERGFGSLSKLRNHLPMHLGNNIHRCKFCPLTFPSSAERRLHLASHTNEDPETREQNLKALQEDEAKLVVKTKERSKTEETSEINEISKTEEKSKGHPAAEQKLSDKEIEQPSTEINRHKCDICGKKFRYKAYLTKHKPIHSKEKPHKCDLCEKQFAQLEQLKVHIRTHTGERPYKCKYCEQGFAKSSTLNNHLRRHLGKNIYRCKFCPLAFPSYAERRLHLPMHKNEDQETRERNLKALQEEEVILELKFSKERSKGQSTEELQQQKLSDKEIEQPSTDILAEQPYECPYCPLRFSTKANASNHKTIHEGIKPHKCSICGKQFRQKAHLIRHKLIHSEEKPHKCDLCAKRFAKIGQLKVHIHTHTGEKPYKCKYCERGFAAAGMVSHLRGHLGKNIYRCKFCPLAFPSAAEMRLHLVTHKNEDQETRERNLKALQEEEFNLKIKFSKKKSEGQSTEELQQQKSCDKKIEQQSTERDDFEEFVKNEPIEDDQFNREYSDEDTMHSTVSVTKNEALPIKYEDYAVNETRDELEEFIKN